MAWITATIVTTDMDAAGDNPGNARAQILQCALNINIIKDARNQANGVASLDASSLVPLVNLPTTPANKGGTGQTAFVIGDIFYADTTNTLAKLGIGTTGRVLTSNGAGAAPSWQIAGGVPSTTRMSFNQTAAPTGWTKDTSVANDALVRIVTGSVTTGGTLGFSTFNAQTTADSYTLTTADLPHLTYQLYGGTFGAGSQPQQGKIAGTAASAGGTPGYATIPSTAATGSFRDLNGGGAHAHTITHDIKYNDFIIATKD